MSFRFTFHLFKSAKQTVDYSKKCLPIADKEAFNGRLAWAFFDATINASTGYEAAAVTYKTNPEKQHKITFVAKASGWWFLTSRVEPLVSPRRFQVVFAGEFDWIFLLRLAQKTPVITFKTSSKWVIGELEDVGGVNLNVYYLMLRFLVLSIFLDE